jgi:hypothetical protein
LIEIVAKAHIFMYKLSVSLLALFLASCCNIQYVAVPAKGHIMDAYTHQPIAGAKVFRVQPQDAKAITKSNSKGNFWFHGKRKLQIDIGDPVVGGASYRVVAPGYEVYETNGYPGGLFHGGSGLLDNLGEIQLTPVEGNRS